MQTPTKIPKQARQRRRPCDNCGEPFPVDPRQPKKRFCKEACRYQFHKIGSAFGPLKIRLEKLVVETMKAEVKRLEDRIRDLEGSR